MAFTELSAGGLRKLEERPRIVRREVAFVKGSNPMFAVDQFRDGQREIDTGPSAAHVESGDVTRVIYPAWEFKAMVLGKQMHTARREAQKDL